MVEKCYKKTAFLKQLNNNCKLLGRGKCQKH